MKGIKRFVIIACLSCLCAKTFASELDQKTQRYLDILSRSPENGYLFDRFYNEWLKHEDVDKLEEFLKARAKKSKNSSDDLILALFYEKEGRDSDAMKSLDDALGKARTPAGILMMRANLELFANDPEEAIKDLTAALKDKPTESQQLQCRKLLGRAYIAAGNMDKARQTWKELLDETKDADIRQEIMELMIVEGMTEQALEVCSGLLAGTKDNYKKVMLQLRLGEIYNRLAQDDKELEAYKKALESVESGSWLEQDIFGRIERIYGNQANIEGLLGFYDSLLEKRKNDVGVMLRRIRVVNQLKGPDDAIAAYQKILEITPGRRDIREQFARFLLSCEQTEKAIEVFQKLTQKNPRDGQLWLDLAKLYRKAEQPQQVGEALKKYLACSDRSESVYLRTAKFMTAAGLKQPAGEVLSEMLEKYPDSVPGREAWADYLHTKGDDKQAAETLTKLASDADVDTVLRCAETLAEWEKPAEAYSLLKANEKRFEKNSNYYMGLGHIAMAVDKDAEAMEYLRKQIELAENFNEISQAVGELVGAAKAAGKDAQLRESLQKKYDESGGDISVVDGCLLCELYLDADDNVQAKKLLDELLKKHGNSIILWSQAFTLASRNDDYDASIKALKKLLSLQPKRRGAVYRLIIDLAIRNGKSDQALQYARDWMRIAGNTPEPWVAESRIYYSDNDFEKAIDVLSKASRKFPENRSIMETLVSYNDVKGDSAESRRILWKLFEQTEDTSERLSLVDRLARNARESGREQALLRHFETRAKTNPRSIFPLLALSRISAQLGDYQQHRQYMYKAFELSSNDVGMLHEIADLERQEGDYERAIETMKKAVELDKTQRSKEKMIELYLLVGEDEKGYALLTEQMDGQINDPRQCEKILGMLLMANQTEQALKLAEEFTGKYKDDYRIQYFKGLLLRLCDQPHQAADVFIELLKCDKELPAVVSAQQNSSNPAAIHSAYSQAWRRAMPKEFYKLQQIMYKNGQIINSNNMMRRGYYMTSFGGMGGGSPFSTLPVDLPQNLEDLNIESWAQLKSIYKTFDEKQQKELLNKLKGLGEKYAKVYLTLQSGGDRVEQLDELIAEFPDFEALELMALQQKVSRRAISAEEIKAISERLSAKYPGIVFGLVARSAVIDRKPEMIELFIKTADEMNRQLDRHPEYAITVMNGSYSSMSLFPGDTLTDKQKDVIVELQEKCLDILQKDKTMSAFLGNIEPVRAMFLLAAGKYEKAVEYINKVIKKDGSTNGSYAANMMRRYGNAVPKGKVNLEQLSSDQFPPQPRQTSINMFRDSLLQNAARMPESDKEKFVAVMDKVEEPFLKLSLFTAFEPDKADALADRLAGDEKSDEFDLAAAGSWYRHRRKNKEAAETLIKAFNKSKDVDNMQLVLGQLVVLAAWDDSLDKTVKEFVVKNIDQLKPYTGGSHENERLVRIYERLNLPEYAAKYQKAIVQPSTMPVRRSNIRPSDPYNVDYNVVQELVNKGNKKQAANLMAKTFRNCCPKGSMMTNSPGIWNLENLVNQAKGLKIEDEFLAVLKPAEGAPAQKFREYAMALDKLGKTDEAFAAFETIAKQKPNDQIANVFLIGYYSSRDPEKAKQHVANLTKGKDINYISQTLMEMYQRNRKINERIPLLKIFGEIVKSMDDNELRSSWWAENVILNSQYCEYDRKNFNEIFSRENDVKQFKKKVPQKVRDEYIGAILELCDVIIEQGGKSGAFEAKQKIFHFYGGDKKTLLATAKEMLLKKNGVALLMNPNFNYQNDSEVQVLSPLAYIFVDAIKSDNWDNFDEIMAKWTDGKDITAARACEKFKKLKEIMRAQSDEVYQQQLDALVDSIDMTRPEDMNILPVLIALWQPEKHKSLTPVIIKLLGKTRQASQHHIHMFAGTLQAWAVRLAELNRSEELNDYLAALEKEFMPESEIKRLNDAAAKDKNYYYHSHISYSGNAGVYVYFQVFEQLMNSEKAFMEVFDFVDARPYLKGPHFNNRLENMAQRTVDSYDNFAKSQLFDDVDRFWTNPGLSQNIYERLKNRIRHDSRRRTDYLKKIKAVKPQTLGTMFLIVVFEPNEENRLKILSTYLDKIAALPEQRKEQLVLALMQEKIFDVDPEKLSPEQTAVLKEFRQYGRKAFDAQVKKHLDVSQIRDPYRYQRDTAEILAMSLAVAPEEFQPILLKSVDNLLDKSSRSSNMPKQGQKRQCVETIFNELINRGDGDMEMSAALLNLARSGKLDDMMTSNYCSNVLYRLRDNLYNQYNNMKRNVSPEQAAKNIITMFESKIGADGMEWFLFENFNIDPQAFQNLSTWLDEQAAKTKNPNWLKYKLLTENNYELKRQTVIGLIAKMLDDETLSPQWRTFTAMNAIRSLGRQYDVTAVTSRLLKLVLEKSTPQDVRWEWVYLVTGKDKNAATEQQIKQLGELVAKGYRSRGASGSRNMQEGLAFAVIACETGDFDLAKQILSDRSYRTKYGNNLPDVYLTDLPETYLLMAKYPKMQECLLDALNAGSGNMNVDQLYLQNCIQSEDVDSVFALVERSDKKPREKLKRKIEFSLLAGKYIPHPRNSTVLAKTKQLLADYKKGMDDGPEELIEYALLWRSWNHDTAFCRKFVETVPASLAFVPKRSPADANKLQKMYKDYLSISLQDGTDYGSYIKVLRQLTELPNMPYKPDLFRSYIGQLMGCLSNYSSSERWSFAPENYIEIYETIRPVIETDNDARDKFELIQAVGVIYHMVGDDKKAKECFSRKPDRNYSTNHPPMRYVRNIFLNLCDYEGRKNKDVLIERLMTLPEITKFDYYYSKNKGSSFRDDLTSMINQDGDLCRLGIRLGEARMKKLLEKFEKNPAQKDFLVLRDYYQNVKDEESLCKVMEIAREKLIDDREVCREIGYYYMRKDDMEAAIAVAEKGLKKWPDYFEFHNIIASSYHRQGLYKKAGDYRMQHYETTNDKIHEIYCVQSAVGSYQDAHEYQLALDSLEKLKELQQKYNIRPFKDDWFAERTMYLKTSLKSKKTSQELLNEVKISPSTQPATGPATQPTTAPTSRPAVSPTSQPSACLKVEKGNAA